MKHIKKLTRSQKVLLEKLGYGKELGDLYFIKECGDDMYLFSKSKNSQFVISKSKKKS